jgi:hypothetical protein
MPTASDYTRWLRHKVDSNLFESDLSLGVRPSSRHSNISKLPQPWYTGMIRLFAKLVNFIGMSVAAGTGVSGTSGENGNALNARLDRPRGLGLDRSKENLYIATSPNEGGGRILKMNFNTRIITRVAGDPTKGLNLTGTGIITSVQVTSTSVIYTLSQVHTFTVGQSVRITDMPSAKTYLNITGLITDVNPTTVTLARTAGIPGTETVNLIPAGQPQTPASIGTLAVNAGIVNPYNVVFDSNGNIYFGNQHSGSSCILRVDTDGYISRYCGNGGGAIGNNVHRLNTTVRLGGPRGIAIDSSNNIYFGDVDSGFTVRKIDALTNQVSIIVGKSGQPATIQNVSPARPYPTNGSAGTDVCLRQPTAMTVDPIGENLYILCIHGPSINEYNGIYRYNFQEQKVYVILQSLNGISGDGGPALNAQIFNPRGIEFDEFGNMYLTMDGLSVRRIDNRGIITRYTDSTDYPVAWHLAVKSPTEIYVCSNADGHKILVTTPYSKYI